MRKSVLFGLVTVVVVLAGLLAWYVTAERSGKRDAVLASSMTVLVVVQQTDHAGASLLSAAVVAIDNAGTLSLASIPPGLRVRFPSESGGSRFGTLDDLLRLQGVDAVRTAVGRVLNLEVPFSLEVSAERLATIIDDGGGVMLDPFDPALPDGAEEPLGGDETVAQLVSLPRGSLTAMEFEQELLLRLVDGVATDADATDARAQLDAWAEDGGFATNLTTAEIERLLAWMAVLDPADATTGVVPTVPGTDAQLEPLAIDTARMVARLFRGTEFLSPEQIRVAVFNGNGARQLASLTGTYLAARGFDVVRTSNAESFEYERTYIVLLGDETKAAMLHDVLPSDVDLVRPEQFEPHYTALAPYVPVGTDVLVVLGAGFAIDADAGMSGETDGERQS